MDHPGLDFPFGCSTESPRREHHDLGILHFQSTCLANATKAIARTRHTSQTHPTKGGEKTMKEILVLLSGAGLAAYLLYQVLATVLQPLFNALACKLH